MGENTESKDSSTKRQDGVHTNSFKAGKRTYFFDVKVSKHSDLYLTITESKKGIQKNGKPQYEKHHIYLFKEDFEKFTNSLNEVIEYIKENQVSIEANLPYPKEEDESIEHMLTPVLEFEDLNR